MKDPYRTEFLSQLSLKYKSGTYYDSEEISLFLNFCFGFYNQKLRNKILEIESKELIFNILLKVEKLQKQGRSSNVVINEEALLYLLELTLENYHEGGKEIDAALFEGLEILCMEAFKYVWCSNASFYLFQDSTVLSIDLDDQLTPWSSNIFENQEEMARWFGIKSQRGDEIRDDISKAGELLEHCYKIFFSTLEQPFKEEFGFGISYVFKLFHEVLPKIRSINTPGNIPILEYWQLELGAKVDEISFEDFIRVLEGLSVHSDTHKMAPRKVWDYKQQVRFRNRPLVKIEFQNGSGFCFSPEFLKKRLVTLPEDLLLRYQERLPFEWNKPGIKLALSKLHTNLGEIWFEGKCLEVLTLLGLKAFKPKLGSFPKNIGPPDILAIHPSQDTLFVFECKLLDQEFESKGIRNQLDNFLKSNGYFEKLEQKCSWITTHFSSYHTLMRENLDGSKIEAIDKVVFCFLTYYPTHVEFFDKKIPTPTLVEFFFDWKKANGWPY